MGRGRQGRDELFRQIKTSLNDLPRFCDDKLEAEKKNEKKKKHENNNNNKKRKPNKQTKTKENTEKNKLKMR